MFSAFLPLLPGRIELTTRLPFASTKAKNGKPPAPPRRFINSSPPGVFKSSFSFASRTSILAKRKYLPKIGLASADSMKLSSFLHQPHQDE